KWSYIDSPRYRGKDIRQEEHTPIGRLSEMSLFGAVVYFCQMPAEFYWAHHLAHRHQPAVWVYHFSLSSEVCVALINGM
ncbi:hypothetical protein LJD22_07105, partial [Bacillus velezensis]|nr:hypothetical protein [Bacillus velezensis]